MYEWLPLMYLINPQLSTIIQEGLLKHCPPKKMNTLFLFIIVKCRDMLEQILLVAWYCCDLPPAWEAQRVKVGSYFWISRRSRSLSLRAHSRATRASHSCDSRVCSCNGRIIRSWFNDSWEDTILQQTADVITTLDPQPGSWHHNSLH